MNLRFHAAASLLCDKLRGSDVCAGNKGASMASISDFNIASTAEANREHQVLLCLLQALCDAVGDKRDAESASDISCMRLYVPRRTCSAKRLSLVAM